MNALLAWTSTKDSGGACVITPESQKTRASKTITKALLDLADWLVEQGVTHVAMESTGVFWKPVYNLLEGLELTLLVVNARHIKVVPGRKTDVKDAFAFRVGLLMVDLSLQQR